MIEVNGIDQILERLATALGTDKDVELADAIGVSRQVLSTWRKRGTVPYEKLCEVASEKNISLNWLLLGKGPTTLEPDENPAVDAELKAIGEILDQMPGRIAPELVESDPRLLLMKRTLERIATAEVSTQRQRATANLILQYVFGDKAAYDRFEGHFDDIRERVEAARRGCQEVIDAVGYEPPHLIRLALDTVMFGHGLTKEGAAILLKYLKVQSDLDHKEKSNKPKDDEPLGL
ncbi:helix-turn-helix transcriptional regulator [Methylocaldum szegediense]|jgi:transcriptional regulator with XRE-family HTH domain|uniref:helix-turn-helix transcriptional regulator n=1 Tax=Methylocaldum szegediense TaxID=73780 RepID=UPI00047BAA03|nr:helix-turn-helix transcriptional regulator [Methylocaldum szegediense]